MIRTGARKHQVLVSQPLADAAMERLSFFFDVAVGESLSEMTRAELLDRLQYTAGIIASQNAVVLDQQILDQLPHLRALCLLDHQADQVDLDVMTQAGVRVTSLPIFSSQQVVENALWSTLVTTLQSQSRNQSHFSGSLSSSLRRFSGSLFASSIQRRKLGLLGQSALAKSLYERALLAQAEPVYVADSIDSSAYSDLEWLVIPPDWQGEVGLSELRDLLGNRVETLPIISFSSNRFLSGLADALVQKVQFYYHPLSSLELNTQAPEPSSVVAEQLIAALGFGRQGFHPDNLLNPDVCCESCC